MRAFDLDAVAVEAASGSVSRRGVLRKLFGGSIVAAGAIALGERPAAAAVTCPPGMLACTVTVSGTTKTVCRDVNADADNCGRCGHKCADWQQCRSGVCKNICPIGKHLCGSTCVRLTSDPNNCGACGTVCSPDQACVNGTCVSCPSGDTLCNGTTCTNLQVDDDNCGACGTVCNADTVCTNGVCVPV
ncbi:MAG: hypothetical protein QOG90_2343 [Actinomycetota bacterium]|jgi:hypothetical protein